jgi:hypothetical protein
MEQTELAMKASRSVRLRTQELLSASRKQLPATSEPQLLCDECVPGTEEQLLLDDSLDSLVENAGSHDRSSLSLKPNGEFNSPPLSLCYLQVVALVLHDRPQEPRASSLLRRA